MKGRLEMAETQITLVGSLELVERPRISLVDFDRIQVAPQRMGEYQDFNSLSLEQRRQLLVKLIDRVRSI